MAEARFITISDVNIESAAFLREVAASSIKVAQGRTGEKARAAGSAVTSEHIEQARQLVNSYFPPPEDSER